jgi:hypothetical protein
MLRVTGGNNLKRIPTWPGLGGNSSRRSRARAMSYLNSSRMLTMPGQYLHMHGLKTTHLFLNMMAMILTEISSHRSADSGFRTNGTCILLDFVVSGSNQHSVLDLQSK